MKNKMRKFKNIHPNSDIYIIASGKSLDFLDKSFFDNKITIGINQSYKYYSPKYLVRKEHQFINDVLKDTKKSNVIHFISKYNFGREIPKNLINDKFVDKKNIVVFEHNSNQLSLSKLPDNPNKLIVSHSTITSGIHLAAYMGAKNIILVGHDCGSINGKSNFNNYHTNETRNQDNDNDYKEWLKNISKDTLTLKHLLKKKYNCNVVSLNPFINYQLEGNKYHF